MAGAERGVHMARRMADIQPFQVMALLAETRRLEAQGRSIVHMEIGEPDFATPEPVSEAGIRALRSMPMQYTPSLGLAALRRAIADHYRRRYGLDLDPERVIITPGASGALQLVLGVLVDSGDQVLVPDPGYPCNRHFVRLFEGQAVPVPVSADTRYQLTPSLVQRYASTRTVAAMVGSPSNPTGTLVPGDEMAALEASTGRLGGRLIVDEIYHGLTYGVDAASALAVTDEAFVVNSFSKYFGMTGWRLGWVIAPDAYVEAMDTLAQNLFLSPPTPSQHAALAAFDSDTQAILEERRRAFQERRDYLLPALRRMGFEIPVEPRGAFYIYADCSRFSSDSYDLAQRLLREAGVAVTPGVDFGEHRAGEHLRFAYTNSLDQIREGVSRLRRYLR